jgi:hypothetical protein
MNKVSIFFIILILLIVQAPFNNIVSRDTTTYHQNLSEDDNYGFKVQNKYDKFEKKKDKKKDKGVEDVQINIDFFWCLLINILTLMLITILIYYPNNRQMESIFTFFMFNLMIFMLTFVLNKIKISMGAAFGLFAVFSMLRYRTEGISMKDMTYLFIFISIGLISAIQLDYYELIIINGLIVFFTFILDGNMLFKRELSKVIQYDDIELIKNENYELLLNDIKKRTGLKIHRINIEYVNFVRDIAEIKVYYYN